MNEKQQQLTFDKGITNVPSDAICSDNALAESVGMVYDDGEHRVIQKPVGFITSAKDLNDADMSIPTILYVHKFNGDVRYIGYMTISQEGGASYNGLVWGEKVGSAFKLKGYFRLAYTSEMMITSIGKTLVVSKGDDILFYLWKPGIYDNLGKIPEPQLEFGLVYGNWGSHNRSAYVAQYTEPAECIDFYTMTGMGSYDYKAPSISQENQELYNNLVVGLYSKCKKAIANKKFFDRPFVIRYAVELYDGSYIYQSAPIMMFPSITQNCEADFFDGSLRMQVVGEQLMYRSVYDYSDWSDIVKGVVVFIGDSIELYDTTGDQDPRPGYARGSGAVEGVLYRDGIGLTTPTPSTITDNSNRYKSVHTNADQRFAEAGFVYFLPLNSRDADEIREDLESVSVFYKLFEAGMKGTDNAWKSTRKYIKSHILDNIVTQEQLPDDYYSHCSLSGQKILSYNFRLILCNVLRGFYKGASSFLPYDNNSSYDYHVCVYIKTPSGDRIIKKELSTYQKLGIYFFYPDPRAYKVEIFFSNGVYVTGFDLEEHPYLNGAYYFDHLPNGTEGEPTGTLGDVPSEPTEASESESLPNQIWVSEVNNPFVFKAEGNITVGNGNIIGLSTLTQALSQGQFGQYPLIIFTDEGIWAASTGTTGLFTAIHPMSREVALSDNPCLTQTDGAVFFASEKGLMVVVGNQVNCVSEQLSGKDDNFNGIVGLGNFVDFLRTAIIAYDYRDSMLWLFDKTHAACLVYSIKSGTFGKYDFGTHTETINGTETEIPNNVDNVVNYYPDYLLQNSQGVYSLMRRNNINSDNGTYGSLLITRPMKLENALALKSIMQIRHIHDLSASASMTLRIFASNNLKHWVELHSLRGTPWKYYRFRFDFSDMKATCRFSGSEIITQERRTNKFR